MYGDALGGAALDQLELGGAEAPAGPPGSRWALQLDEAHLAGADKHEVGEADRGAASLGAALADLEEDGLLGVVPAQHEYWIYEEGWDDGFQGFITSPEEIDGLAAALRDGTGQ